MATVTAARAASTFPVAGGGPAGVLHFAYGVYEVASNLAAATIIQMCKVPAGAIVVDGFVRADDLDTGTEELDWDIGWEANGDEVADPDGFGNHGVWTGDATTDIKPEATIWFPFQGVLKDGPKTFNKETSIAFTVNVDAATGGTGTVYVGVSYLMP